MDITSVKWLLEENTFSEDIQPIVDEIARLGMTYETIKYKPFGATEVNCFSDNDCVVTLGSINLLRHIQQTKPWVPGGFATFPNFNSAIYQAFFGDYMLNSLIYLPLAEVKRLWDELIDFCGDDTEGLFIRPASGTKTFTGQIVHSPDHLLELAKPETLCGIACKRYLGREIRFIVAGQEILSSSQYYNEEGKLDPKPTSDIQHMNLYFDTTRAMFYLEALLKKVLWRPDDVFVVDIGFTDIEDPSIVELNSFSCSGHYKCNPARYIGRVAEIALEKWKEVQ